MTESVVPVSVISGFMLLLLSSKRIRTKMAALIAWLVGSITGGRSEEKQPPEENQAAEVGKPKTESKQNKGKGRQRGRKANEEPTFNTKLSTPIEDIIEETINEERSESQQSNLQSISHTTVPEQEVIKPKRKKKPVKKEKLLNKSDEEDEIGYSFIRQKLKKSEALPDQKKSQKAQKKDLETQISETHSIDDNIGFSFFPIKEKNRKGKGKSLLEKRNSEETLTAVIAQGIAKKSDHSRPSIIDHYKSQDTPSKKTNEIYQTKDNSQSFVFINKLDSNLLKTDLKESKKVTSHVSYASVVSNSISENLNLEEKDNFSKESISSNTFESQAKNSEVSSSIEILSQCSEDPDTNNTELAEKDSGTTLQANGTHNEFSNIEIISNVNISPPEKLETKKQSQSSDLNINYHTPESSIEIIVKSIVDEKSHFEKNILSGVLKTVNQTEANYSYNNFQHTEKVEVEVKELKEELTSQENLNFELPGATFKGFADQGLENIIDQLVHEVSPNILEDNNKQIDIKNFETLLNEKSFPEAVRPNSEISIYDQNEQELVTEKTVFDQNTTPSQSIFEESTEKSQNGYLSEPGNLSCEKVEDRLSSSKDSFISEIVEDFIKSEVQQELITNSNLYEEEVQEILANEQFSLQQESAAKHILEIPVITNPAYILSENQSQENIPFELFENQTNTQNQRFSESLIKETQTFENINHTIKKENLNNLSVGLLQKNTQSDLNNLEGEVLIEQYTETSQFEEHLAAHTEAIQSPTSTQEVSINLSQALADQRAEESPFAKMTQVRVLTLNDKEHQESTIFRIEKNFILQFRLGPSLLGRKIKLYCNYPKEANGVINEFDRGTYQLLSWCQDEGCKNADDTASFAQIVAKISGSYHYYFIYENEDTEERQGSGYFLVDPVLKYGDDEDLPLDCIQCQTVIAKQLGPFSTWENKLKVAKESGYNVVHFTPIQELGASKSAYSLSEQLKLNSMFNEENGQKPTFGDVEKLTTKMRKEWKMLSICDIVLNHTANESEWIKEHPEATYNCVNCPYMRPAYLLDAAFHQFSMDVKKGYYEDRGIPAEVSTEEHLNAISYQFKTSVLEPLKLQELFIIDVNSCLERFLTMARKISPISDNERTSLEDIEIIQDPEFRRLKSTIDLDLALKVYNTYRLDCFDEESRVKRCSEDLKKKLDSLNEVLIKDLNNDLNTAVENVIAGIRYFRVQSDGPKFRDITINHPLVYRYFTDYGSPKSIEEHEEIMYSKNGQFLMAHNGWVMNSDPLKNFASAGTKTYIRRELIAWGDSVKLRYGDRPEDSPFLWDHMRKYVEQTAKIFDGVRLDNCHSTPIPVAEYLLDAARKIRPDLYVVAELFTNSDLTDNIFVNRLGITSLIREAMSAWDSHEEGRLVYRYGGVPVGSFYQPSVRPLVPMVAHALFLDLTHDNPSPVEKRSVFDLLPSTALVNMACCASGSNRGYDELVPHHIHVVDETRQYAEWSDDETLSVGNIRYVNNKSGIIAAKKALNELHFKLGKEGYNQVYVDQMDPDIVAVTRHNPETHTSYVLVAFTAFQHPDINAGDYQRGIKPLRVEGVLDEIVLEASLTHIDEKSRFHKFDSYTKDSTYINGLSEYQTSLKQHIQINQSDIFEEVNSGTKNVIQLNFKNFKPGSIAVVKVSLPQDVKESVSKVRSLISSFAAKKDTELRQIISKMSLADLNRALYRCDQEERDEGNGFDAYNIPNFGPVVYCGLQGFMSLLANIRPNNDLGHPFCANLRDGNWLIEYIWKRLKVDEGTKELGQWVEENTKSLHSIPRYLIPCYFDVIVTGIYINLLEQSYNNMSDFVKHGSTFVRSLSLGSLQFGAYIRSADLPVLSPNLAPPKPPTRKNENGEIVQACVTFSAGLPHFSVGYMRNWGRDTFIALRGLFILTGRFEEARQHILGYAACLRHGLIPNLLDGGRNPRFNCRDAIWWWLYCIKSYCEEAPNGTAILSDKVSRIFPTDDSTPQPPGAVDQPLYDVIQEALKVHFQGLKFRERNAGRQIDEHMTDAGFNNQIGIHPETGFVFGGNQWNCGTWMDKMGSSDKAGNRGKPATPRDGSAVELVGLSKAAVSWLWKLNQEGKYPYDGVERTHKNNAVTKWTFKEWSDKIQENFESNFWIGATPSSAESRPDLINKKSIYKDSFGASQPWTDYQLRPNFTIAMVAAPEMFDPQHAWAALEQAEKYLLGPLGMKTLDPEDWNYRGDYDNSNDSNDFNTSHGFNYHQGPEWVWPVGFFLRAKLIFAAQNGMLKETLASTKVILSKHFTELQTSPWRGLPELTNSNGSYCRDSSRTQAWSMSCILEVLHDLQLIESKQIIVN